MWVNNNTRKWFYRHFVVIRFFFPNSDQISDQQSKFDDSINNSSLTEALANKDLFVDEENTSTENPINSNFNDSPYVKHETKQSKSILIPQSEEKNPRLIPVVSGSIDLDSEKFVRFGE